MTASLYHSGSTPTPTSCRFRPLLWGISLDPPASPSSQQARSPSVLLRAFAFQAPAVRFEQGVRIDGSRLMFEPGAAQRDLIREALRRLGKRRLILAIHDASFPSVAEQDFGRGSPYTQGGLALVRLAYGLGFDALQLGPQGQTSRDNPSPYDGTFFSRNLLSVDLFGL